MGTGKVSPKSKLRRIGEAHLRVAFPNALLNGLVGTDILAVPFESYGAVRVAAEVRIERSTENSSFDRLSSISPETTE
jgi:hypothetical protein